MYQTSSCLLTQKHLVLYPSHFLHKQAAAILSVDGAARVARCGFIRAL